MRKAWLAVMVLDARCVAPSGSVECIAVPMKDGKTVRDCGEYRVGCGPRRARYLVPAKFRWPANDVLRPIAPRDQLAAETNAKDCLAAITEGLDQPCQRWKIGVIVIGQRILITAQHNQAIMIRVVGGQGFAKVGLTQIDACFHLLQCAANLPQPGILVILNDENAHETCLISH